MIIFKADLFANLQNVIEAKAKFQKVLLIYDEQVPSAELNKIANTIKTHCVFNQVFVDNITEAEIYNGYKLLVFFCSAKRFFKLNFNLADCINFFIPTDCNYLPFFVDSNFNLSTQNNYLFLSNNAIDENIIFSCLFNCVYSAFNALAFNSEIANKKLDLSHITQQSVLNLLQQFENEQFIDFKILKQLNLDYENLPMVDYFLLLALDAFTTSIKDNNLSLTDVYKNLKSDYAKINKFYSICENKTFLQAVNLNFFYLNALIKQCVGYLNKIFDITNIFNKRNVNNILSQLKNYATQDNLLLNYLFLYNVFG